jgi:hypothetical protein
MGEHQDDANEQSRAVAMISRDQEAPIGQVTDGNVRRARSRARSRSSRF